MPVGIKMQNTILRPMEKTAAQTVNGFKSYGQKTVLIGPNYENVLIGTN